MAKKIEKILTKEQTEDIILFVYNMVKDGNPLTFLRERTIITENDEHSCDILTSMFGDNKEIAAITIKNKSTSKDITIYKNDIKKTSNVSSQFKFLQKEVTNLVEINKPVYYEDDEIGDIIGDPSLLGKRSVKVNHLIDNIEGKIVRKKKSVFNRK